MKIIIKEREVEYTPDYPDGWKFSANDPFKFPVVINGYSCFIKRFEKKDPEDITGWALLQKLKGRYEQNLPRVYDIEEANENGKSIHYVFYECINGTTLEHAIAGGIRVNLSRLTDDLFAAFQSIHKHGFWFVDFCEKNIFFGHEGRYLLVDLDSADIKSALPSNDMYGSKDYWIPVFRFYKDVLQRSDIKLSDISGPVLNYLQAIFLILRLKEYYANPAIKYKSESVYESLHTRLDETDSVFRQLFAEALDNGKGEVSTETIGKIRDAIHINLLNERKSSTPSEEKPAIKKFTADNTNLNAGETITLSWEVQGADKIELYRNNELFKTIAANETRIQRAEFKDGASRDVVYELIACKNGESIRSKPIIVTRKKEKEKKASPILWIGIVALLAIAAFFLFNRNKNEEVPGLSIRSGELLESNPFVFYGKNLNSVGSFTAFFNNDTGFIQQMSDDSIVVLVPELQVPKARTEVEVLVRNNNDTLFREHLPYIPIVAVKGITPKSMGFKSLKQITVKGKNLTDAANIRVFFRNLNRQDSIVGNITDMKRDEFKAGFNAVSLLGNYASASASIAPETGVSDIVKEGAYYDVLSNYQMLNAETQARLTSFYLRHDALGELQYPGFFKVSVPISVTVEIDGKPVFHDSFKYYTLKFTNVDDRAFGDLLQPSYQAELHRVQDIRRSIRSTVREGVERISR